MKIITRLLIISCIITSLVTNAQKSKAPSTPQPTINAEQFKGLKWRNIGPYRGGRSNAVSGLTNNDQVYFTGYTGGGLWKTDDAGISWKNISDGFFKTGTVGDIAISESDPNVIYVGMGEHAVRGVMTSYGDGVYKSVDGGKTWKNIGLEKTRHIADIVVHPTNSDIVLVAAQGAVHGASADRGVYKSTDGGATWKKVLYIGESTGASSLSMDMTNPRILYAATWQHRRYPWKVESGGSGSSIWKSVDGGDTWNKIDEGLPKEIGKIGVSVSRANPNRVYAIVEAEKSKAGLYRSDDGGKNWNLLSNDQNITARSWYYMEVYADPIKEDLVYVLNAPMMRSIDGGRTFENISIAHGDCHDLWINPKNSNNIILGDDGGGSITYDGCKSWSTLNNQPTSQFYRVNVDNLFPFRVYGGQQDNYSVVIKSRNNSYGLTERDWFDGPGCESAYIAFNPNDPTLLYGGCYQGNITVLDTRTNEHKDIMKYPSTNLAYKAKDMKYRFNWNAPLIASPHDPSIIYHAANVVLKTTNGGISWEEISPDLTRNDTTKQQLGGGPITNEGAGGENYNTIYYLIESPHEKGVLYAGSDCGLVHITKDGGKSWQKITPAGLPESMVQSIEVSPHDKATVYISASRYKFNDFSSLTFKSTDYGKTWTRISNGVDADDFIKVIREDKKVKDLLYAGSERGFYISINGGVNWNKFQLNLPVVPVTDLIFQGNDLVASTAGRSFWILDDVSAVQQSRGNFGTASVKLFQPKPTVRYPGVTLPESAGSSPGYGVNPLDGVVLDYYLKEKADTNKVTLEILDGSGKIIRSFSNKKNENFKPFAGGPPPPQLIPAEAGVNRFAWDIRTETLKEISNAYVYGDYRGHRVAPGKYRARMTYKGETSETEFELIQDPNLKVTPQDWNAQQQFMVEVESKIEEMHAAVNSLRNVKKQIGSYNEMLSEKTDATELVNAGKELIKKIDQWESNIVQTKQKNFQDVINFPSKLNTEYFAIRSVVDAHDPRVTQGARDRFNDLEKQWSSYKDQMKNLISNDVATYNKLFKDKNIPALVTKD
jgi:photosystem II stability/assembly factor-like uncharacterized protein